MMLHTSILLSTIHSKYPKNADAMNIAPIEHCGSSDSTSSSYNSIEVLMRMYSRNLIQAPYLRISPTHQIKRRLTKLLSEIELIHDTPISFLAIAAFNLSHTLARCAHPTKNILKPCQVPCFTGPKCISSGMEAEQPSVAKEFWLISSPVTSDQIFDMTLPTTTNTPCQLCTISPVDQKPSQSYAIPKGKKMFLVMSAMRLASRLVPTGLQLRPVLSCSKYAIRV